MCSARWEPASHLHAERRFAAPGNAVVSGGPSYETDMLTVPDRPLFAAGTVVQYVAAL